MESTKREAKCEREWGEELEAEIASLKAYSERIQREAAEMERIFREHPRPLIPIWDFILYGPPGRPTLYAKIRRFFRKG